jgi:2-polyprenyl-3-methyl-5-hydroxy-6-metoxy-1,4-benzoquinol methylase
VKGTWDIYANRFSSFDEYNHFLTDFLDLLGDIEDKKILDLGCSNGLMCRLLAQSGAKLVGIDRSFEAIELAQRKEREHPQGIDYHLADAVDLNVLADESFDAVIAVNVLCSLGDSRETVEQVVLQLHGKLRNAGVFVCVIPHPAFENRQGARTRQRSFPKGYSYFDSGTNNVLHLTIGDESHLIQNTHWTMEDYFAFFRDRFRVTDVREPEPDERFISLHPDMFVNSQPFPIYLMVKGVKQS